MNDRDQLTLLSLAQPIVALISVWLVARRHGWRYALRIRFIWNQDPFEMKVSYWTLLILHQLRERAAFLRGKRWPAK